MVDKDLVSRLSDFTQNIIENRDSTREILQEQDTPAARAVYRSVLHAYNQVVCGLQSGFPELKLIFDEYERKQAIPAGTILK